MLSRLARHLTAPAVASRYPPAVLERIAATVARGESRHRGEICFAVESALPLRAVLAGQDARTRAHAVFAQLQVWDTAGNNGVLVYLLLADRRIEIVADRGLEGLVSAAQWRGVCALMEGRLRADDVEAAAQEGISTISDLLASHFPRRPGDDDINELPDTPHVYG